MKRIFSHPLAIVNFALFTFLALLILNVNAERLHLSAPVKEALAAVAAITGQGTANKLAAFAAVNQIGDSIITDNGSAVTVSGPLTATNLIAPQVNTNAIQGGSQNIGIQTCSTSCRIDMNAGIIAIGSASTYIDGLTRIVTAGQNFTIAGNVNGGNLPVLALNAADVYINGGGNLRVGGRIYGTLGDYAEWFEKEGDARPGDLIGLNTKTGKARKYQAGDHFLGIYSVNPAIATNATASDSEMVKTHALVGLLGQLDFDRAQAVIEGRIVKTPDGVYVGVLLSNGKVLIGR